MEHSSEAQKTLERLKAQLIGELDASEVFEEKTEEPSDFEEITDPNIVSLVKKLERIYSKEQELDEAINLIRSYVPREKPVAPLYYIEDFKVDFFGFPNERVYKHKSRLNPIGISMVVLRDFFTNTERFTFFDPTKLPGYERLDFISKSAVKSFLESPTYTSLKIVGDVRETLPTSGSFWLYDKVLDCKFIVNYAPVDFGVEIMLQCARNKSEECRKFSAELEDSILSSKYIRGQILEVSGSGSFDIVELKEQLLPAIEDDLRDELTKNVINIFDKQEKFSAYNLPAKRAIIIEGSPGNGKTMISRYLAHKLKGRVTVLWTSAKAISNSMDISYMFTLARKLSPVLLVLEDLDLIAGSRSHDEECLGELLSQLDGLLPNENLVVVASTNEVKSLDRALNDRPGRFDRIYTIKEPSPRLAEKIAMHYLNERSIDPEVIRSINYSSFCDGHLTGAQIVEVCKGAIYEAIHRNKPLDDLCFASSFRGLNEQRKIIRGDERS